MEEEGHPEEADTREEDGAKERPGDLRHHHEEEKFLAEEETEPGRHGGEEHGPPGEKARDPAEEGDDPDRLGDLLGEGGKEDQGEERPAAAGG